MDKFRTGKHTRTANEEDEAKPLLEKLRLSSMRGDLDGVTNILNKGYSPDQTLSDDWTSLMYACSAGRYQVVGYLLKLGANPNIHVELYTPLMASCAAVSVFEGNLLICVELLLESGANVNAMERHRVTPLMFACREAHEKIVAKLVQLADLNIQDSQGWTALFWAVKQENIKLVQIILNAGAKTDIKDRWEYTALDLAHSEGLYEIEQLLDPVPKFPNSCIKTVKEIWSQMPLDDNQNNCALGIDVVEFLFDMGMQNLSHLFKKQNIDIVEFLTITDEKLLQIGVDSPNQRNEILLAINKFHCQPWTNYPTHSKLLKDSFSLDDGLKTMSNILRQLNMLYASTSYVRHYLQNSPINLPLHKRTSSSQLLQQVTEKALKQSETLYTELKFLHHHIRKLEESDITPGDVIVEKKDDSISSETLTMVVLTSAFVGIVLWKTQVFQILFSWN